MSMATEYENALTLISEIEIDTKKTDVSFVNISDLVEEAERPKVSYSDALQLIGEVESGGRRFRERPLPPAQAIPSPQPIPQPVPATTIPTEVPKPKKQMEKVEKPGRRFGFQVPVPRPSAPKEMEAQRKQSAAAELSSIVGRLQRPREAPMFPEIRLKKKVNMKDLVLPNLSVADQISELERIIEGLRENIFNDEQFDIVVQEAYGLEQTVIDEKKRLKGRPPSENELEKSLYDIRDQRLTEVATLLQQLQRRGAR